MYTERLILLFCILCSHHGWVSFECSAEIYNETMRETENFNHKTFREYGQCNPKVKIDEDGKICETIARQVNNLLWDIAIKLVYDYR